MSRRDEIDDAIIADYRSVARAMDRAVLPLLVEHGITMGQLKALMSVNCAGEEGISISTLGERLSVSQPSASLLADQLVRDGLAVRSTDEVDRRRVLVKATPKGRDLVSELRHGRRSTFTEWLSRVSDDDAVALARGMRILATAVEDADRV